MKSNKLNGMEARVVARYNLVKTQRKNITFNIDEELLERLDAVAYFLGASNTRNKTIEEAISWYVEEAETFIAKQELKDGTVGDIHRDTVVLPALHKEFSETFMVEHRWTNVYIEDNRTDKIKFIALYRGTPISAITHYAKVISIGEPDEDGKRTIKIEEPEALPHTIMIGDVPVSIARRPFYTYLDRLKSYKTLVDVLTEI